ncbi:MAG: class I SAM-dependent methyltransferase [Acidimicrobiaceae bacterium]|nr:class I SAM-dependent methyltransferase [Acidimicrobiaceae bacterium]
MLNRIRRLGGRSPFGTTEPETSTDPEASPFDRRDWPALHPEHVPAARLFADRKSMIASLGAGRCRTVVEVGVGFGDFSAFILENLAPTKFVAIDLWEWHHVETVWGRPTKSIFGDLSHIEYYRKRFAPYGDTVAVEEGVSWDVLGRYPDEYFDLIYVDAGHDYESVKRDAEQSVRKVKADGLLIFNDYTLFDNFNHGPYGIVQAVNELVVHSDWKVVGFSLEPNMFCDIALSRQPAAS